MAPPAHLSIHRASSRAEGGGQASFLSPSSLLSHRIVLGAAWGVQAAGSYRIIVFRDRGGLEGACKSGPGGRSGSGGVHVQCLGGTCATLFGVVPSCAASWFGVQPWSNRLSGGHPMAAVSAAHPRPPWSRHRTAQQSEQHAREHPAAAARQPQLSNAWHTAGQALTHSACHSETMHGGCSKPQAVRWAPPLIKCRPPPAAPAAARGQRLPPSRTRSMPAAEARPAAPHRVAAGCHHCARPRSRIRAAAALCPAQPITEPAGWHPAEHAYRPCTRECRGTDVELGVEPQQALAGSMSCLKRMTRCLLQLPCMQVSPRAPAAAAQQSERQQRQLSTAGSHLDGRAVWKAVCKGKAVVDVVDVSAANAEVPTGGQQCMPRTGLLSCVRLAAGKRQLAVPRHMCVLGELPLTSQCPGV